MSEVTFFSINQYLISKIPDQFTIRDMDKASADLDKYIDSLFLSENKQEEDKNDGSEID